MTTVCVGGSPTPGSGKRATTRRPPATPTGVRPHYNSRQCFASTMRPMCFALSVTTMGPRVMA